MEWTGHANVTDLFQWLKWLDPQGLRRKMDRDMGKALGIASRFVKERLEQQDQNKSRDFLNVLLDFQSSGSQEALNISDKDLNIFILEIFLAGSETTSSTVEWAMTELLCNRECLMKVKSELSLVVGHVTPSTMDMTEKLGITMRKLQPLLAVPKFIATSS
ncbi:hypothetical protein VNO77_17735 [Canavalia gladiata]|uniref:Uncharacterized protein n=1 Tax=Canavalia gladiata TaxID=3824 RepID=A0AAN9QMZ5_CANGL